MQISTNTTGLCAGLTVATDKLGDDYWVVAIKGTFVVDGQGLCHAAEQQVALVYSDVHYGLPDKSSIAYESDFALYKPCTDVVVEGSAVAPLCRPIERLLVGLEIGAKKKQLLVLGDRWWERGVFGIRPSAIRPFREMPLRYELAFGGSDCSHANPRYHGTELRNPVGLGYHCNPEAASALGTPLPNLENPLEPIRVPTDVPAPHGFGAISRTWQPRLRFAGTFDHSWINNTFPFLPADFDNRYFLCAPPDQQVPHLRGGEIVRCTHMTPEGEFFATLPQPSLPVIFQFMDRAIQTEPLLDTVVVQPTRRCIILIWRARMAAGHKLTHLREIRVGLPREPQRLQRRKNGKPYFRSLAELAVWRQLLRRRAS